MRAIANQIIKAQDFLRRQHGERDYNILIEKMKQKTDNNIVVLSAIAKDESMSAAMRLLAIATMGE